MVLPSQCATIATGRNADYNAFVHVKSRTQIVVRLAGILCVFNRGGREQAGEVARPTRSNIQILHIQRVLFDELAAGFDVFAH
jgi:hypothetical protein